MIELNFVASIAERDVDLLVLEELSVSDEFREWFSSRIFGEPIFQNKIGAWHSVTHFQLGESDLVFLFEALEGPRTAVLIENKIGALPQPQQGERYRSRGEKGCKEGYWETFKTCLIAPNKYLLSEKNSESYDVNISYEELLSYFQSRRFRDERFQYKARILLEAIEKNRRGYQPGYSDAMTQFVSDYYNLASNEFSHLEMQKPKPRPSGSSWIEFYPKSLKNNMSLVHQLNSGFIKLFFYGQAESFEILKEKYKSKLSPDTSIDVAGKSVAISMEVPKVDPLTNSFADEVEKVRQALVGLCILEKLASEVT